VSALLAQKEPPPATCFIEGDVQAAEVLVGEKGRVTGMVAGQQVIVRGTVLGVVCAQTVALQSSCHVESDVHHMSLAIEQGAHFHGNSRRAKSEADLSRLSCSCAQSHHRRCLLTNHPTSNPINTRAPNVASAKTRMFVNVVSIC
jgi:hypothetical protein